MFDFTKESVAEEHPVLLVLSKIVPDELSPKEALEKIYILKEMHEKE